MDSKQKLLDKISSDAAARAQMIREEGKAEAEALAAGFEKKKSAAESELRQKIKNDSALLLKRRLSVAELEVKKELLKVKQEVMDMVFTRAANEAFSGGSYLNLVKKLLTAYMENGEVITICKADEKRLTKDFFKDILKNLDFVLSDKLGAFSGGFLLSGKNYDKNLTLHAVLAQARENLEPEIAKILFN